VRIERKPVEHIFRLVDVQLPALNVSDRSLPRRGLRLRHKPCALVGSSTSLAATLQTLAELPALVSRVWQRNDESARVVKEEALMIVTLRSGELQIQVATSAMSLQSTAG
jgi:hypothetical protein